MFSNKLKDVYISYLLSDGIQDRNDIATVSQNKWSEGGLYRKKNYHQISDRTAGSGTV